MNAATMRLVLLVSLAHAMVHVYEQALPSVEVSIGQEMRVGPETTGPMGTAWRVPFGVGAVLAGWLADRFGTKRLLLVYLLGCAATAVLAWWSTSLAMLFAAMFAMGCFASIYHPAGLAIISHETTPDSRGRALGWHGIFGSVGIAAAPLIAACAFQFTTLDWRQYYLLLAVPGLLLAITLWRWLPGHYGDEAMAEVRRRSGNPAGAQWSAYFMLLAVGVQAGFLYAAFTHFLPRYLSVAGFRPEGMAPDSFRTLLAAVVLLCGAVGQGVAGRLARPHRLTWLLSAIMLGNAPLLLWMAVADGYGRLAATCLLGFVHFMQQPVYNSLIPRYVPSARLSLGFGFSNMLCFGLGALGPSFAGYVQYAAPSDKVDLWTYGALAVVATSAGLTAVALWRWFPHTKPDT